MLGWISPQERVVFTVHGCAFIDKVVAFVYYVASFG